MARTALFTIGKSSGQVGSPVFKYWSKVNAIKASSLQTVVERLVRHLGENGDDRAGPLRHFMEPVRRLFFSAHCSCRQR